MRQGPGVNSGPKLRYDTPADLNLQEQARRLTQSRDLPKGMAPDTAIHGCLFRVDQRVADRRRDDAYYSPLSVQMQCRSIAGFDYYVARDFDRHRRAQQDQSAFVSWARTLMDPLNFQ